MNSLKSNTPLLKVFLLYPLIMPVIAIVSLFLQGWNWIAFLIIFALTYPLWCFGICYVKYYEEYMIVVQPFCLFRTRIIRYDQIEYIKEATYGKHTVKLSPWDLFIYVKDKKEPIGIPMPKSKRKQQILKSIVEFKGISIKWGLYE